MTGRTPVGLIRRLLLTGPTSSMAKPASGGLLENVKTIVYAGLIAVGSVIGGQIGAKVGRRLPPPFLRAVIVTVGLVAVAAFVLPL